MERAAGDETGTAADAAAAPEPPRELSRAAGVAAVLAAFAVTAAAFVLPQAREDRGWDTEAARYAGLTDGAAGLIRITDATGAETGWRSSSVSLLAGSQARDALPDEFQDTLARQLAGDPGADPDQVLADPDALRDIRVFEANHRELGVGGDATSLADYLVADATGVTLLGTVPVGDDGALRPFTPGLLRLPADPAPGARWESEGTFGGAGYTWSAEVTDDDAYDGPLGAFEDCVTTEATLILTPGDEPSQAATFVETWCDGVGNVATQDAGPGGSSEQAVAALAAPGPADAALPAADEQDDPGTDGPEGDPTSWTMTPVGSAQSVLGAGVATFSPVYVPSNPPVVLAATETTGDVVALGLGEELGVVQWRIAVGGATYSRPRWDPDRQRLYFGATDGYVRAVDARGLFLWAAAAEDAVPGTPVVLDDVVVFGSEDGTVHGVDADTGEPLWEVEVEAPVASGGAALDGTVVIADTAGVVWGLDPDDGREEWHVEVGGAVEAPVGTAPDGVLVADRAGGLTLIGADGEVTWTLDAGRGTPIRPAPVVVGDAVLTVDDFGIVTATALDDGAVIWRREGEFAGAFAAVGDLAVAATESGQVVVLDDAGQEVQRFDTAEAVTNDGFAMTFTYGPAAGGGQLWAADGFGFVWSIGPEATP